MFDRLFKWLLAIQNPFLASLLGAPNLAYTATFDPAEARRHIERIEEEVFGPEGLTGMEGRTGASSLGLLARRSYAQFLGRLATLRYPATRHFHLFLHSLLIVPLFALLLAKGCARSGPARPSARVVLGGSEGARKLFETAPVQDGIVYCSQLGDGLGLNEVAFLFRAVRAFPRLLSSPPLMTNILRWLSRYGWVRRHHGPKEIAAFAEGIPACSILTGYLREHGIRHVNHMHGERFHTPAQAFCCFDEISVWGEAFRDLFLGQRWRAETIRMGGTPFHRKLFREVRPVVGDPRTILVIHTQLLTPGSSPFLHLIQVLAALGEGWAVNFRPHYHQLAHGRRCFEALKERLPAFTFSWQDPARISLEEAITQVAVVVGAYSTALLEAWIAGRRLIHLPDEMKRSALMERYGGSPNVLFAEHPSEARAFAEASTVDDPTERARVNRLVRLLAS